jgi:DNA-binding transcriptional regulator YiaG
MAKKFTDLSATVKADPRRNARVEEYKRAMYDALALAKIRDESGVTQQEIAASLGISQSSVSQLESRIERHEDLYLSTLGRYVAAMGGHLELTAVFPDRKVNLAAMPDIPKSVSGI